MNSIYDKFDYIIDSYWNGNFSQAKSEIKALSRDKRFDLVMYSRNGSEETNVVSDTLMRWCVTGDFK